MSAEIHTAQAEEWRAVRDLRLRALADAPDAFGSTLERERAYGEGEWLGWISGWDGSVNRLLAAVEREAWIGMAVGSHEDGRDHVHLYGMWVDPVARRRSLGSELVEAVIAWAIERRTSAIELGVTESNPGAVAFYRRMGFADTGERSPLRDGSALAVIKMRRDLAAR